MKKNITYKKFCSLIKSNWPIICVIFISLILHILALNELGFQYSLDSDDVSYILSGLNFKETGMITMHGALSAQIMPGMTFLIAIISFLGGTYVNVITYLKILWLIMGLATIFVVYKTIRIYTNKYISAFSCLFFLSAQYIWMDNIILTETPFILLFSLLIYHTFKLPITNSSKDYICIVIFYLLALLIRPNIGIYPLFLIIYLLIKKYDIRLMFKQLIIAFIALMIVLVPWTIRNYKIFGKFIPLTYGVGNPLLLGTYQGTGYPLDSELDYSLNVDNKMPEEMEYYLNNFDYKDNYMARYYLLEKDNLKAKYRIHEWWQKDKASMIKSYFYIKPVSLLTSPFYWEEILGIKKPIVSFFLKIELILTVISSVIIIMSKKNINELIFLILVMFSQVALYSYTFVTSRYGITLFFMRYLIIGLGINACIAKKVEKIEMKRKKVKNVLIIVPAYNEELNIVKTVNKIIKYNKKSKYNIDYIVINDGSYDNTKEICEENKYNTVNLISNLGIGGAVQTGYKYALKNNYDVAIQFDGDGQHDENYIETLIKEIEKGNNFVIGSRFISNLSKFKSSSTRRFGIKILSILIKICTGQRIYDPTSGFRAADKMIIREFSEKYPTEYPEPESTVYLLKKGYNISEVGAEMHEREFGTSSIKPLKSIYYMFSVCISILITSITWRKQ